MGQGKPGRPKAEDPESRLRRDLGRAAWNVMRDDPSVLVESVRSQSRSQIRRLWLERHITTRQAEALELVGKIYGTWERVSGLPRRACASPSYDRAYGRSEPSACNCHELVLDDYRQGRRYGLMPERRRDLSRLCPGCYFAAKAREKWDRLNKVIKSTLQNPTALKLGREVLEMLCVGDLVVHSSHYPGLGVLADAIARTFHVRARDVSRAAPPSVAAGRARRAPSAQSRNRTRTVKAAWLASAAHLRPDLGPEQLEDEWAKFQAVHEHGQAVVDRDQYRAEKARRRKA